MTHFYSDFVFCKNNFFRNPKRITDLANSLDFNFKHNGFPGNRTENLAVSTNNDCQEFSIFFAKKLCNEVYTNITDLHIDIRFHKYPSFDDLDLNTGWTHIDNNELLAGLVYLNEGVDQIDAGTSFFTPIDTVKDPDDIRKQFNEDYNLINLSNYKDSLLTHNKQFRENIKVGNLYNRLITYDANIYHRPTNYFINNSENRLILVFVISKYSYKNREYEFYE
jgi:hypothetical protein